MCLCPQLSDQMVELFEACQQQSSDLSRKEMFRARLQQDIQRVYAGVYDCIQSLLLWLSVVFSYSLNVFLAVARLYLTGSSMNGLGCRSSDADLCLVLKGNVSISDSLQWMSLYMCNICSHRYPLPLEHLHIFFFCFLFQKRPDPIHVLSVLQRLFKSLCE